MHTDTCHCKVFGQLGTDCFDDFAPARTRAYQAERLGQRHTSPWWGDDVNPLVRSKDGALVLVNEAFVRCDDATTIAFHQGREALDVVRAGRQEGIMGDQTTARDTQTKFEPIVMQ